MTGGDTQKTIWLRMFAVAALLPALASLVLAYGPREFLFYLMADTAGPGSMLFWNVGLVLFIPLFYVVLRMPAQWTMRVMMLVAAGCLSATYWMALNMALDCSRFHSCF